MNKIKMYFTYYNYIDELLKNQNMTSCPLLQDIFSKKDYEKLLKNVIDVLNNNPHNSITN